MTDQEFAILEELLNKHQAELREVPSKPKQKAEEKPKKLKLSPLSYARVSRFFHKMYVRHLTRKIDGRL